MSDHVCFLISRREFDSESADHLKDHTDQLSAIKMSKDFVIS